MAQVSMPEFFIVGAPKCGTTWLFTALERHPQIAMTSPKECNVLSREIGPSGAGLDIPRRVCRDPDRIRVPDNWRDLYREHLPQTQAGQIVGDGSMSYNQPKIIRFILEQVPTAKFIFLMRDPVERAKSARLHRMKTGEEIGDVDAAIQAHKNGESAGGFLIESGLYARKLERIFEIVPREQVLVLVMERMLASPTASQETLTRIFKFLGVESRTSIALPEKINVAKKPRSFLLAQLHRKLQTSVALNRLRDLPLVGNSPLGWASRKLRRWNWVAPGPEDQALTEDQSRQLAEIFAPDIERLEHLLGERFPEWRSRTAGPRRDTRPASPTCG